MNESGSGCMKSRTGGPASAMTVGGLLAFLVGSDSMVVAPIAPAMMLTWAVPVGMSSLLVAAYAIAYAATSPFLGALADRIGRRRVAGAGILMFAAGTALTGFAPAFSIALIGRSVAGLGAGAVMPAVFAEVSDRSTPQTRAANLGLVTGLMPAATVIGVPLGTLLAARVGWPWVFHCIAVPAMLCLLVAPAVFTRANSSNRRDNGPQPPSPLVLLARVLSGRPVRRVLGATFLWNAGLAFLFTSIGAFYHARFAVPTAGMSGIILAAGAAGVAGAVLGGRLASLWGVRIHLVINSLIGAAGVLCMVAASVLWLSVLGNIAWSLAAVAGQPALTTLAASLDPKARGTVLALNGSAQYLAQFVASSCAALVIAQTGGFTILGVFAAMLPILVVAIAPVRAGMAD